MLDHVVHLEKWPRTQKPRNGCACSSWYVATSLPLPCTRAVRPAEQDKQDTAALIDNVRLDEYADEIVTVPEVLAEVRNEVARRQMQLQLAEIKTRQPSGEALKFGKLQAFAV